MAPRAERLSHRCNFHRNLHPARINRAAAAFRRYPVDVLPRVLDVAGLAVHAVLRVDLQTRRALLGPNAKQYQLKQFIDENGWPRCAPARARERRSRVSIVIGANHQSESNGLSHVSRSVANET